MQRSRILGFDEYRNNHRFVAGTYRGSSLARPRLGSWKYRHGDRNYFPRALDLLLGNGRAEHTAERFGYPCDKVHGAEWHGCYKPQTSRRGIGFTALSVKYIRSYTATVKNPSGSQS